MAFTLLAASLVVLVSPAVSLAAEMPDGLIYKGAPVSIGKGTAQVVVHADASGRPQSISVEMSHGSLQGLPATANQDTAEGQWEYALPMPAKGPKTGYTEVVIDWNPHGHPPPHIYTVPHFDFHFYVMPANVVDKVAFSGPDDPATKVTDTKLIPSGYQVIANTAVNKMGVHAIDSEAPEFHGKPFTATFIYGYYKGQLIFVEPMVTRALLQTKPNLAEVVRTPESYSVKGYYPTRYGIHYDAERKSYIVALDGLRYWQPLSNDGSG